MTNAWYYQDGACNQGAASKISFTIDTDAPTLTVSDVSTDNYINATEDDSAVSISGTSSGLTTGATVTVKADGLRHRCHQNRHNRQLGKLVGVFDKYGSTRTR